MIFSTKQNDLFFQGTNKMKYAQKSDFFYVFQLFYEKRNQNLIINISKDTPKIGISRTVDSRLNLF